MQEAWFQSLGWEDPWVGKIPWRRERLPTPVFWPGEFLGVEKSWTRLSDFHFHWKGVLIWTGARTQSCRWVNTVPHSSLELLPRPNGGNIFVLRVGKRERSFRAGGVKLVYIFLPARRPLGTPLLRVSLWVSGPPNEHTPFPAPTKMIWNKMSATSFQSSLSNAHFYILKQYI